MRDHQNLSHFFIKSAAFFNVGAHEQQADLLEQQASLHFVQPEHEASRPLVLQQILLVGALLNHQEMDVPFRHWYQCKETRCSSSTNLKTRQALEKLHHDVNQLALYRLTSKKNNNNNNICREQKEMTKVTLTHRSQHESTYVPPLQMVGLACLPRLMKAQLSAAQSDHQPPSRLLQ